VFEVDSAAWTMPASSKSTALRSTSTKIGRRSSRSCVRFGDFVLDNSSRLAAAVDDSTRTTAAFSPKSASKYLAKDPDRHPPKDRMTFRRLAMATSRAASAFEGSMTFKYTGKAEGRSSVVRMV